MDTQILITYATKHGSTAEISEKIGEILHQSGYSTDVLSADQVTNLQSYKAVILGSGVYAGQWLKKAARFLKANEKTLAGQMVWIFSSGPTGKGDPLELLKGWRIPASLQPVADRIKPKDITVFHGNNDEEKLSFFEKRILKLVKAPSGDFRDWDAIAAWASGIAGELKGKA
ncbi:MAG: flavodoxin domain-containing protein [Bacteroidales bacterium]|nr:flavodoxin domain-containing protein [Bacteroidales bacterium]